MTTAHDDLPHPIPPFAHLRYKENYFFILLAELDDVFGVVHFNHEPGFDRARYTANFSIRGKPFRYSNQTSFPANFEMSREIGDGHLSLAFREPHARFDLSLVTDEINLSLVFTARQPTFDYAACRTAGGNSATFQEVLTLGLNLPYNHQQQALNAKGSVVLAADGKAIDIDGSGYRDHSWVMRADNIVAQHTWCGMNFPSCSFGAKTIETTARRGLWAREGYISDSSGVRALTQVETTVVGETADGLPKKLVHELVDVFGQRFTIESDIGERLAHVPLVSEAPGGIPAYHLVENFCRSKLLQTGETGIAVVEIGRTPALGGPYA